MLKSSHPMRALLGIVLAVAGLARAASAQQPVYATSGGMMQTAVNGEYSEMPPHYAASDGPWQCGTSAGCGGPGVARGYLPGQGGSGCGWDGSGGCDFRPDYGCGPCGGCGDCCLSNRWAFGAGGAFLSARWKTNPAFVTSDTSGVVDLQTQTDFSYGSDFAPLVWVEWRADCGLGFKGRAWWYDGDDQQSFANTTGIAVASAAPLGLQLFSAGAGDSWTFDSSLKMDVQDLMMTYSAPLGCGWIEFGVGARRARIEQEYRARLTSAAGVVSGVDSASTFEGVGPSFSLEGRLSLTQRLSLITALRYSLIIGAAKQDVSAFAGDVLTDVNRQSNQDFRPVTEVEFGVDYALCGGCWEWYVQAAFVAQLWQGAGNSANSDPLELNGRIVDESSDKNADLLLYGLRLEMGLRF